MSFRTKAFGVLGMASIAVATPVIATWEGVETKPYKDIGGVWTVCYGETENIDIRREYTKSECDEMLAKRVPEYYSAAMEHVTYDIPITMRAAITSFTYNVGAEAFKRSTMLKKINKGDLWDACQELDRWAYVGRMWVRGLANRRAKEKELCVAEIKGDA
jgi:lysozyme